ncbi:Ig-like domain-containing protein [Pontibacillus sp. HMF3514]|uniref:Ig-like domain-containing protein n=1 Tax=Pontibacillus sp. HMF3514 TaxID=2692425 RepID=UPI001320058D|nr:Ig-like domain-containing protein [Pontibacillus sp. HMF3514]QHE51310.1 hypothetical protein GS400_04360 [Pontibacillus sp. HMF3514]
MQKSFISLVVIMLLSFTFLPSSLLAAEGDGDTDVDADLETEGSVDSDDGSTETEANASTVNKLELSSSKSDVMVGENMQINVKGWDANGNIIEDMSDIQYSVNNESVATVNSNGELIPKAAGTVTVTVSAGDVSENFTFNVMANKEDDNDSEDTELDGDVDSSLNLTADERKLNVGEELQLSWDGLMENENVSFELSDNSKANITDDGMLTAENSGNLTVWLKTDEGRKTKLDLMIHSDADSEMDMDDLDSVKIDAPKANVNLLETLPLDVDGFDVDGNKWEDMSNVTFSVDDESKATIDANGHLHPKEEGKVTVTATANGMTDTMDIMIDGNDIDGINLDAPKSSIGVNEKLNLEVNGIDSEGNALANLKNVEFKVSDKSVATIDGNGQLVAKTTGTVKVWAMLDDKQDSFTVDITGNTNTNLDQDDVEADLDEVTDISLESSKADMNINEKLNLWVKGLDEDGNKIGTMADVWFDVSNEDIAEVTEDGYLLPKAEGTVTITANAEGKTDTLDVNIDGSELSDISFDTPEADVDMNGNMKLKVNGKDENGNDLEDLQNIDFEVSDESVATVDSEGNITPKSEGTVTVTASSDNYEDEMTLTVASNNNSSNDTEMTNTGSNNDWNNEDSNENWTSASSDMSSDSNSDSLTTPGVPSTGDGSSQSSMAWSWIALGLMAIAGTSVFAWRKQQQ